MGDFVAEAAREIGYTENPPGSNRTKFAAEAGHANGQPWCATFIVAIARRCGVRLPNESAYTPTMWNGFKGAGRSVTDPKSGDLAFFDFPDSKDRVQHVGIVESATATHVTCIEGNTSPGTTGSQDNGGGVYRRTRPRKYVVGFGRPAFAPTQEEDEMTDAQMAELKAFMQGAINKGFEARDPLLRELVAHARADASADHNAVAATAADIADELAARLAE